MTMKNNLIGYKNFNSENPASSAQLEKKQSVNFWKKKILNKRWIFKRTRRQYVKFYQFLKWIFALARERIAFFLKNLLMFTFLKLPFFQKFALRKKFFFQLELNTYFMHTLPENVFTLKLVNFNDLSFFRNTIFLKNYGIYFYFKKLNLLNLGLTVDNFLTFLEDFSFFFKEVDNSQIDSIVEPFSYATELLTPTNMYFMYYYIEVYKLCIFLHLKLIF